MPWVRVLGGFRVRLGAFSLALAGGTVGVAVAAAGSGLGQTFAQAVTVAERAHRGWAVAAFVAFLASMVATAGGWRTTLASCGGRLGRIEACAWYGAGSLVNSVLPARSGEAVRVGLYSRAFRQDKGGRTWVVVGALGAVTIADALVQTFVVGAGVAVGRVPGWSLAVFAGVVVCIAAAAAWAAGRLRTGRLARVLEAFRALFDSPRRAVELFAWLGAATGARLLAAVAIALSLAMPHPASVAVVMCAVAIVAAAFPLTPGNVGVTSGAIAVALHGDGISLAPALAAGLAFHAIELLAGIVFGLGATVTLAPRSARIRGLRSDEERASRARAQIRASI